MSNVLHERDFQLSILPEKMRKSQQLGTEDVLLIYFEHSVSFFGIYLLQYKLTLIIM